MKVSDRVLLEKFTAAGAVSLLGADISGQLSCRGAQLNGRDKKRNALHGERMKVGGDVLLQEKFTTTAGAVCLLGADISGQLSCHGAQLNGTDEDGNALHGDGIRVGRDVLLDAVLDKNSCPTEKFSASGAISLASARAGTLRWAPGQQISEEVNLRSATVGELSDDWGNGSANGHWPKDGRLSLDGFTYGRLSGNQPDSVEDRLNWIRGQYPESPAKRRRLAWVRALFWNSSAKSQLGFATQPYEQLTAVYRQAGQDDKAREVAIARRKDLRKYGNLNWYSKFGNWFLYWSIGYGYRTWRAAVGLAALFVIFLALSIVGQHQHAIVPTKAKDINGLKPVPSATQCTSNYPCFYPAGYAIDKVLPIIKVYQADYWVPDGNAPWGWFWVGQTWVATGAGWALVTLLVVGYTGLVRRD